MSDITPTPSGSRDAEATASHPIWCDTYHLTAQVHAANFGTVEVGERQAFDVEAIDYGTGDGPQVLLAWRSGDNVSHLTSQQARDLARLLAAAADILDAAESAL